VRRVVASSCRRSSSSESRSASWVSRKVAAGDGCGPAAVAVVLVEIGFCGPGRVSVRPGGRFRRPGRPGGVCGA
jgi:hypothetical protein